VAPPLTYTLLYMYPEQRPLLPTSTLGGETIMLLNIPSGKAIIEEEGRDGGGRETYLAGMRGIVKESRNQCPYICKRSHGVTFPRVIEPVRKVRGVRITCVVNRPPHIINISTSVILEVTNVGREVQLSCKEAFSLTAMSTGRLLSFGLSLLWTTKTANLVRAASLSEAGRDCSSRSTSFCSSETA
jgi:hypothetical protein